MFVAGLKIRYLDRDCAVTEGTFGVVSLFAGTVPKVHILQSLEVVQKPLQVYYFAVEGCCPHPDCTSTPYSRRDLSGERPWRGKIDILDIRLLFRMVQQMLPYLKYCASRYAGEEVRRDEDGGLIGEKVQGHKVPHL